MVPASLQGSNQQSKSQRLRTDQADRETIHHEMASLAANVLSIRILILEWCLAQLSTFLESKAVSADVSNACLTTDAIHQDYESILDGEQREVLTHSIVGMNTIRCLLFLVRPDSDQMYSFLRNYLQNDTDFLSGAYNQRLQYIYDSGLVVTDELVRVVLRAAASPENGIHSDIALDIIEELFHQCNEQVDISSAIRIQDSRIVLDLYDLSELIPSNVRRNNAFSIGREGCYASSDSSEGSVFKVLPGAQTSNEDNMMRRWVGFAAYLSSSPKPVSKCASLCISSHCRLASPGKWWRVTALNLIICGKYPAIGKFCFNHYPTLRALIKMVTSDRYIFPTVDCTDEECEKMNREEQMLQEEVSWLAS